MKGLVLRTTGKSEEMEFEEPLYETVGEAVGGYIEIVHPVGLKHPLLMVVDEEGLLKEKEINIIASMLYGCLEHGQLIAGDAVIMAEGFVNGEPDIIGLTDEQVNELKNRLLMYSILYGKGGLQ